VTDRTHRRRVDSLDWEEPARSRLRPATAGPVGEAHPAPS